MIIRSRRRSSVVSAFFSLFFDIYHFFRLFRIPESSLLTYVLVRPSTSAISAGLSPSSAKMATFCRRVSGSSLGPRSSSATTILRSLFVKCKASEFISSGVQERDFIARLSLVLLSLFPGSSGLERPAGISCPRPNPARMMHRSWVPKTLPLVTTGVEKVLEKSRP